MNSLSPAEERLLDQELLQSESVIWTGRPNLKVIFHSSDLYMVPFSLMWGGFALFWEWGVTGGMGHGAPAFFTLWSIPFVLVGQYFIWGRFLYARWKKQRVLYVLTTRRAMTIVRPPQARTSAASLQSVSTIEKQSRSDGIGTLTFGQSSGFGFANRQQNWDGLKLGLGIPVFVDIDNVAEVFAMAQKIRSADTTGR